MTAAAAWRGPVIGVGPAKLQRHRDGRGTQRSWPTVRPTRTAAAAADPSRLASLLSIVKAYPASTAACTDCLVAAPALPIGLPAAAQALTAKVISSTTRG